MGWITTVITATCLTSGTSLRKGPKTVSLIDFLKFINRYHELISTAALVLTLIYTVYRGEKQQEQFQKQLEQQRQQWLDDGYRKAEIDNWLDYRNKFYYLTSEFKSFLVFMKDNEIFFFRVNPKQKFESLNKAFVELYNTTFFLKPYFKKEAKLDCKKTQNLLRAVQTFYEDLVENYNKLVYFEDELHLGWTTNNTVLIKKILISNFNNYFDLKLSELEKDLQKSLDKAVEKFTNEIDKINVALEEITLPPKLRK